MCDDWPMVAPLDSPHERLSFARERAGYADKAAFASAVGVNPTTYRAYENGQNGFGKLAGRFAKKLGVTAEWLLEGGPPPNGPVPTPAEPNRDDESVEITQLDLSFSMGPGTSLDDYIEESRVKFDLSYIRSFTRTETNRLHIARGVGESMYPTLATSDMVWIDTTQKTLNQQDRIWAISLFGAAAIKRLRTIGGGKVLVISDNPAVENQEVDASDVIIGGRVIRFARDL